MTRRLVLLTLVVLTPCSSLNANEGFDPPKFAPPEPTITFTFENKKWSEVIDWFRIESGLVFAGNIVPVGTITVRTGPGKKYSIPMVIDLLNELLSPKYVLIRREQTFTVLPADEPIEPGDVRVLTDPAELVTLGRTEIVQLVVPLGSLALDDVGPAIRLLVSTFGKISPFGNTAMLVQDKVVNVNRIVAAITKIAGDADAQERYAHACKYLRATTAAETLKALIGPDATVDAFNAGRFDRPVPRVKGLRISVQEEANVVLVAGPADKVNQAKSLLRDDIDRGTKGTELPVGGGAKFLNYAVAPGTAQTVAATLLNQFKNSSVTVTPVGTDRIHVFGFPADHAVISRQILTEDPNARGEPVTEIVPLVESDPKTMAALMTKMFPVANGLPIIDVQNDGPRTGVLVRGLPDQVKRIRKEITALDNPDGQNDSLGNNRRVIPIPHSSGILAECLADFVRAGGKNDVIIFDPVAPPVMPKAPPRVAKKRTPPVEWTNPMPPAGVLTNPMDMPK